MTDEIAEDKHIKKFLIPEENVLLKLGDFYATNKRLLRYRRRLHAEEFDDIAYAHLSSISFVSASRALVINIGIVFAVLGVAGIIVNIFIEENLVTPICGAAAFVGIVLMVYGIFSRITTVQFRGTGISDASAARLKMTDVFPGDAQEFISVVREHLK